MYNIKIIIIIIIILICDRCFKTNDGLALYKLPSTQKPKVQTEEPFAFIFLPTYLVTAKDYFCFLSIHLQTVNFRSRFPFQYLLTLNVCEIW